MARARQCSEGYELQAILTDALQHVSGLEVRADQADEERRRSVESSKSLRGSIRIVARIRPPILSGEGADSICLRVLSKQHLEVLLEPRALLTEQSNRHRRRTTGGIHYSKQSMSASMLGDMDGANSQGSLEPKTFYFDELFDQTATDDDVFAALRGEVVSAVDGEAVCILAYGSTGSGKTHTVLGVARRAAKELERQAEALQTTGCRMEIKTQVFELHNYGYRDLLFRGSGRKKKPANVTSKYGEMSSRVIIAETSRGIAASLEEALRVGQAQRVKCATAVHGSSSRSHLVMELFISVRNSLTGAMQRRGKLSLVDLAGTERLKKSEVAGSHVLETALINKSLSALIDVIAAKERRNSFVPFRSNKLTKLLQDGFGGEQQCRTVIIIALPPSRDCVNETLQTLQFSSRLTALALPMIAPRRSLTSPTGSYGGGGGGGFTFPGSAARLRQQSAPFEKELGPGQELNKEVGKLKTGYKHAGKEVDSTRNSLQWKGVALTEVQQDVDDLRERDEGFEKSREQLAQGVTALNQRLREVEAVTSENLPAGVDSSVSSGSGGSPSRPSPKGRLASNSPPRPTGAALAEDYVKTMAATSYRKAMVPPGHEKAMAAACYGWKKKAPTSAAKPQELLKDFNKRIRTTQSPRPPGAAATPARAPAPPSAARIRTDSNASTVPSFPRNRAPQSPRLAGAAATPARAPAPPSSARIRTNSNSKTSGVPSFPRASKQVAPATPRTAPRSVPRSPRSPRGAPNSRGAPSAGVTAPAPKGKSSAMSGGLAAGATWGQALGPPSAAGRFQLLYQLALEAGPNNSVTLLHGHQPGRPPKEYTMEVWPPPSAADKQVAVIALQPTFEEEPTWDAQGRRHQEQSPTLLLYPDEKDSTDESVNENAPDEDDARTEISVSSTEAEITARLEKRRQELNKEHEDNGANAATLFLAKVAARAAARASSEEH